jgi:septum site-determining protein MinD
MGHVILIASGKGGTGKTFFAANLGALLAMRGKKVVLIDMDMGLRNLDLYLGLENRVVYNVMDVVSGVCKIKQALIRDKRFDELYLMAASPMRDQRDITPLHMEVLCGKLKDEFDYIIIDAPAGIGDGLEVSAAAADTAVIVTEPDNASVRDADILDNLLTEIGVAKRLCVLNKVNAELMAMGAVPGILSVAKELRVEIAGIIQYDTNILIANNRGIPIVVKQDSYIAENLNKIADRVLEG